MKKNRGLSGVLSDKLDYDGWHLIHLDERRIEVIPSEVSYIDVKTKIKFCERYAKQYNKSLHFKLFSNKIPDNLDKILQFQHYSVVNPGIVMSTHTLEYPVGINGSYKIIFFENYHKRFHELRQSLSLEDIEVGKSACFCELTDGDVKIGIGFAAICDKKMGIFNVLVEEGYRRQGVGTCLISAIFRWGKDSGATSAYLHVAEDNLPAIALYHKLGFVEEAKVWYRIQTSKDQMAVMEGLKESDYST
jgi:ribosomal protein S18 acetylase RimI-like enzyme